MFIDIDFVSSHVIEKSVRWTKIIYNVTPFTIFFFFSTINLLKSLNTLCHNLYDVSMPL